MVNEAKQRKFALTFDIDWAPDCAILQCINLLEAASCKATFFTTHQTDMNKEIVFRGHELGIHPNFLSGSSHGSNVESVISNCLTFAPDAWCMRTHALVQSSPILIETFTKFPQLKLDVSLFMNKSPYVHTSVWDCEGVSFKRLLYNWQDDANFNANNSGKNLENIFFGDVTVYNFHPIHIALNSSSGDEYKRLKQNSPGKPLNEISSSIISRFENAGLGARVFLERVLNSGEQCIGIGDI